MKALPRLPRLLVPKPLALGKASTENRALKDMLTIHKAQDNPMGTTASLGTIHLSF